MVEHVSCVQVVNRVEVDAMANVGVPFFGVNLAVGLSVALPGLRDDITRGLLGALPQVPAPACMRHPAGLASCLPSDHLTGLL
jgi:hypothetical protein